MSSQLAINTLKGGMAPDLDPSVKNENSYDYAENLRYMASIYPDSFVLHTVDGYSSWQYRSDTETARIVGACRIRNYIVIFTTIDSTTYSTDKVYLTDTSSPSGSYDTSDLIPLWEGTNLYCDYSDYSDLEFVSCVGRYESADNVKVYWSTSYRPIRCYNALIGKWTPTGSGTSYLDADYFNLLPPFSSSNSISPDEMISGELTSGTVYYTMSLLKDNLQESVVLPVADGGVSIYSDSIEQTPSCLIKGDTEANETNKGVKLTVNIDTDDAIFYDKIRVYRIHYETYGQTPTITIVGDYDIDSTSIYDTGGVGEGEITLEEFSAISGINYYAKSLESKDNILFAANIKENVFDVDFDARAYRFNSSGIANIYDSYTSPSLEASVTSSNWDSVSETLNCVNLFNSLDYEFNSSYQYKFQSDGVTFGAEGPEIEVSFTTQVMAFDDNISSAKAYGSNNDDSNPIKASTVVAYQRGEVYRFGIVFISESGSESDVKWICDLKIPGPYEDWGTNSGITYISGSYGYRRIVLPEFTLKNGLPTGATGFRIVRADRTMNDRSVVKTGLYTLTYDFDDGTNSFSLPISFPTCSTEIGIYDSGYYSYNSQILSFIDPETVFYKENEIKGGDVFIIAGVIGDYVTETEDGREYPSYGNPVSTTTNDYNAAKYRSLNIIDSSSTIYSYEISSSNYMETTSNTNDGKYFNVEGAAGDLFTSPSVASIIGTYYTDGNFGVNNGLPGRRVILGLDSACTTSLLLTIANLGYAMIKRNTTGRYGGFDYQSILNTEYIPCSKTGTTAAISYMGDVHINYFDYLYNQITTLGYTDPDYNEVFSTMNNIIFPVESPLNISLRGDEFNYGKSNFLDGGFLINETAGSYEAHDSTLQQTSNLYLYNSVYSQQPNFKYSYSIDEAEYETTFDNRIIYSNQKFNDENIDSWTKFKVDNFLDVDGNIGPITAIKNANDNMYFFQEDGFGVVSINQRSLISDGNAGELLLGTGDVLSRYDYISRDKGLQHKQALSESNGTLYWIDENNKSVLSFNTSEGLNNLGLSKGISSYLNKTTISDFPYVFASSRHNEVLFKYEDNKILVYDTAYKKFPSFYTFQLNYMFDDGNHVVYDVDIDDARLYRLYGSTDSFNKFETTNSYQDSVLRVTCSKDYPSIKTFSHIIMYNRQRDNTYERSGTMEGGWFDSVKFYNTYQYSEIDDLYNSSEAARREKTYVVSIPRNFIDVNDTTNNLNVLDDSNYDTTRKFRERLRDTHLIAEFTYSPTTASSAVKSDFIIPYIGFGYQKSIR